MPIVDVELFIYFIKCGGGVVEISCTDNNTSNNQEIRFRLFSPGGTIRTLANFGAYLSTQVAGARVSAVCYGSRLCKNVMGVMIPH
jgi:hypothetical protein